MEIEIKEKLFKLCLSTIENKIEGEIIAMNAAQESANSEDKNSAGDKHETGRAMAQLEKEKYAKQIAVSYSSKKVLHQIDVHKKFTEVLPGCIVKTNQGNFFIAINVGDFNIDGVSYKTISLVSPLGQVLFKKKENDEFVFRDKKFYIQSII